MPPRVDHLREPTHRVVRTVALGHLADATSARDRLALGKDDEALHDFRVALRRFRSWERAFREYTRDDLSRKRRRQMRDLARDTGASRDLEVHLAWLASQRGSMTRRQRPGLTWLLQTLDRRKAEADAVLERDVDRRFTRLKKRLEKALSSYRETIRVKNGGQPVPLETFAGALAPRVREQAAELRDHITHIRSLDDGTEAHEARIAAKRTRYLLEPIAKLVPGAADLVERLKSLQDVLGDLHDAQVFGEEVERLASSQSETTASSASGNGTGPRHAAAHGASATSEEAITEDDSAPGDAPASDVGTGTRPLDAAPHSGALGQPATVAAATAVAASAALAPDETSTRAAEPKPRPAPDIAPGVAVILERLRERADASFAQFMAEWSGDASDPFFRDVEAVATTLEAAAEPNVEIERKYLLRTLPNEAHHGRRSDIDQGYIPGAKLHERVRRVTVRHGTGPAEVRFYRTVKLGEGVVRTEIEEETTATIFEAMWPLTKGRRLKKRRYAVEVDGKTWELDEFRRRDLVLAEIELESEDERVTLPPWLAAVVEREVSGEPAYQNINLAR